MARTFDSQRLRHQRRMDQRLTADQRILARNIAALVLRAATARDESGAPIVPNSRAVRQRLNDAIWEQVLKPYYIGSGTDALRGAEPRSPFALLLVQGITEATRIQVLRQVAIVRRVVHDETVLQWLTGPRPFMAREMVPTFAGRITELVGPTAAQTSALRGVDGRIDVERARGVLVQPRGMYEPFHSWVDPNGYRLSDRIWRTSIDVRSRIDRMMEYHISRGTSAVQIADALEPFLTPGALQQRTQRPYGTEGSYAARRLARTEITAAAGRATVNASAANPFVNQMQWRLSGSHPRIDICDTYARGGPNGDGIYPLGEVPPYPPHPHCLCSLLPVPAGDPAELVASLRADIQAARGNLIAGVSGGNAARARALQGILNPEYMQRAILSGSLDEAVAAAVRQSRNAGRLPVNVRARPVRMARPSAPATRDIATIRQNVARRIEAQAREAEAIEQQVADLDKQMIDAFATYNRNPRGEEAETLRSLINTELPARRKELVRQREPLISEMRRALLAEIELPEGKRANVTLHLDNIKTAKTRDEMRGKTEEAAAFVNRITAVSQFPDDRFNVAIIASSGRENAKPGQIMMNSKTHVRTIVHEIGHNIETKRGAEGRAARVQFFDSRTSGDKSQRLRTLLPDHGYGKDEITKKDRWHHPYTGKIYPHDTDRNPASEIISMGIEALYAEPHKLVNDDPDFFDFLIAYLQGK